MISFKYTERCSSKSKLTMTGPPVLIAFFNLLCLGGGTGESGSNLLFGGIDLMLSLFADISLTHRRGVGGNNSNSLSRSVVKSGTL